MLSRDNLHDYQIKAVDFILSNPKCALWVQMGLGKTVSTLTAVADMLDSFSVSRVLVIAPLRVANTVWHTEIKNWSHLNRLSYAIATGTKQNRIDALNQNADITMINRENVPWLVTHYGKKWPFDCVVIDESSSFKSPSSQRFKALRKVMRYTDSVIELTGTPSPNGLLDLWSQIYLLDTGERLGRSMTAYKSKYFESDYMGYSFTPRNGSQVEIEQKLKDITLSITADGNLDLPERIDLSYKVQLPPSVLTQYKQLEKEFLLTINKTDVEALSAATLANKLLQICNGCVYDEHKTPLELHSAKLDALHELVEDNPTESILVAYNYKSDLTRLKKRFPQAVELDKNPKTIDDWNNGKIKMLLAHPASAGHGINLQKGGNVCVWFGLNWSLELYEQFNARLYRQGQKSNTVRIIHLVADGCIDEKVMLAIGNKAKTQAELIQNLK